jgi:hypothetical protein
MVLILGYATRVILPPRPGASYLRSYYQVIPQYQVILLRNPLEPGTRYTLYY